MATTPNFNWSTPDNTGLVKNGALDIRTLGNSIDASLADLKGGTSGQVLAKATNTDMDFTWVTDATGIPATIFDAKGDIIAATAADTASRLAVGANNTVLTADSSTATGLKWATPSSPSASGCAVYANSISQTFSAVTNTILPFAVEEFDTDNYHSNTTNNSRITIPTGKGGTYLISAMVNLNDQTSQQTRLRFYKNGSLYSNGMIDGTLGLLVLSNAQILLSGSITTTAVAGDYFEIAMFVNGGVSVNWSARFQAVYLGA